LIYCWLIRMRMCETQRERRIDREREREREIEEECERIMLCRVLRRSATQTL